MRIGVFPSKSAAMQEETPNPRNGFTLTAAASVAEVSQAYESSLSTTFVTITDIYITDTLPPEPFDPNILAGASTPRYFSFSHFHTRCSGNVDETQAEAHQSIVAAIHV
jgi:hypothetical protein